MSENLSLTYQYKKVEKINKLFLLDENRGVQAEKDDVMCFIIFIYLYLLIIYYYYVQRGRCDVFKETC